MGIGASVVKRRKSLGLWSEQEKLAIMHAEQTLRRAASFAAEHFYYNGSHLYHDLHVLTYY